MLDILAYCSECPYCAIELKLLEADKIGEGASGGFKGESMKYAISYHEDGRLQGFVNFLGELIPLIRVMSEGYSKCTFLNKAEALLVLPSMWAKNPDLQEVVLERRKFFGGTAMETIRRPEKP